MKAGSARYCAVRILEGDELVEAELNERDKAVLDKALAVRKGLATDHGWPESAVFSSHRHAIAVNLSESVSKVASRTRKSAGELIDSIVMHPFSGPLLATVVIAGFFGMSFFVGNMLSGLVSGPFEALNVAIGRMVPGLAGAVLKGIAAGVGGGIAIVLPYLLPLLFFLSVLEDIGYLPRAAFLMDGVMHRIGLHGKSAIPLIMGFGCNVPSILGARVLESRRDRILTVLIAPFIACSARTVVILALVGAVLGPWWVLAVYVLNIVVAAGVGRVLSSVVPGMPVGLLMDIPPYRVPPLKSVIAKVWFRTKDFLISAWPALIVASVIMALLESWGIGDWINRLLAPFTSGLLGLPAATGITLVFGLFRKELTLIMLFSALGTTDVLSVMTPVQVMTFVVFVLFYIPCVATIVTQVREIGWKWTGLSVVLNVFVATVVAVCVRLLGGAFSV
jgi:ferrous iron transport protein B